MSWTFSRSAAGPFHGKLAQQEVVAQIEVLELFELAQRRTQSVVHFQPGEVEGDHVQLIVADDPRPRAGGEAIARCPSIQSVVRVLFNFGLELQERIGLPGTVSTQCTRLALEVNLTHACALLCTCSDEARKLEVQNCARLYEMIACC